MKKYIVIALALLLIGALASAEGFTPSMFLGSRGLMVMDENQMNSMGGSSGDTKPADAMKGLSYGALSLPDDGGAASIVFFDGEKFYAAIDMTAMFGGGAVDHKGMGSIFVDFCKAYDFDVWMIGGKDMSDVYVKDTDSLAILFDSMPEDFKIPENITHEKDVFIESVKAKLGI